MDESEDSDEDIIQQAKEMNDSDEESRASIIVKSKTVKEENTKEVENVKAEIFEDSSDESDKNNQIEESKEE